MPEKTTAALTQSRKLDHINIILNKETQYREKTTMLECVEISGNGTSVARDDVDLRAEIAGIGISAPVFVSGMTGGHRDVLEINRNIAKAVEKLKIPMGVGSQRAMIEDKSLAYTYDVKKTCGEIVLIGNIGATSLIRYGNEAIQEMLDGISADMLAIHTNPGQESVQPEGDVDFRGVLDRIFEVARYVKQPTILKEVGNGISKEVAQKLDGKVYGIDVQGAGGTTWIGVETYRSKGRDGLVFWDWGIPTALSVLETKSSFSGKVFASGGIRNSEDIVKAIALGADLCGMAKPILTSERRHGSEGVYNMLDAIMHGLREKMAALGFKNLNELKNAKVRIKRPLSDVIRQRGIKMAGRFALG